MRRVVAGRAALLPWSSRVYWCLVRTHKFQDDNPNRSLAATTQAMVGECSKRAIMNMNGIGMFGEGKAELHVQSVS
jgi:hypothetical protein